MLVIALIVALLNQTCRDCETSPSCREKLRSILKRWSWEIGRLRSLLVRSSRDCTIRQLLYVVLAWVWMTYLVGFAASVSAGLVILSLELAFAFSQVGIFTIFPLSVEYCNQIYQMMTIYICNIILVIIPSILSGIGYVSPLEVKVLGISERIEVMLFVAFLHVVVLALIIKNKCQSKNQFVLLNNVDKCIPVNLTMAGEGKVSLNHIDETSNQIIVSHYLVQSGQKFQIIAVSKPTTSKVSNSSQPPVSNKIQPETNVSVNFFEPAREQKKSTASNLKSQELPHLPNLEAATRVNSGSSEPEQLIPHPSENRNPHQPCKDIISHCSLTPSVDGMTLTGNPSQFTVKVINMIELKDANEEGAILMSFDESHQRMIISTQTTIHFYEIPSFKKIKMVILDSKSKFIMHESQPMCVQYFEEEPLRFAKIDLTKEGLKTEDLTYKQIAYQNPSPANGFVFFGSFAENEHTPLVDTLFMRDGRNLVAVSLNEALSIETYEKILPQDHTIPVKIVQLNCRQIVMNTGELGSTAALKKVILDIPTNLSCRILTQLPVAAEIISIKNLQNQIILNIPNSSYSACVYDLDTKEIMELPKSTKIYSAWFNSHHLFVIDQSKSIKIFPITQSKFNLAPSGENGLFCVSLGFL